MLTCNVEILNPIAESEFDELISGFGLFEANPVVAVGVSGGADSLCLLLLLDRWLRRKGGRPVALMVDHGMRSESQKEIKQVVTWLEPYDIENHTLVWKDPKPKTGRQAAARKARYELLTSWCQKNSILHLAVAHHQNDQAETLLLRKGRGSGPDGLACMPRVWERNHVRILRPLLSVPRQRLKATLQSTGQKWIDDPSNDDGRYARTRVRRAIAQTPKAEFRVAQISELADEYACERTKTDVEAARLLGSALQIHPAGFCVIDKSSFKKVSVKVGRRCLTQILICISGNEYGPRKKSVSLLYEKIRENEQLNGRTLGGCCIKEHRDELLFCREPKAASQRLAISSGQAKYWDHRFMVTLEFPFLMSKYAYEVRQLGETGWVDVKQWLKGSFAQELPLVVKYSLPALWDLDGLVWVPHLNYKRSNQSGSDSMVFLTQFRPRQALAATAFQGIKWTKR